MKKYLAIFLAVAMVMSLLPMNLFGARPGQIRDPRNSPVHAVGGVTGWPEIVDPYTFRIDAAALSQLALDGGSMAILDFVLDGGASASQVGFAAPWTISQTELAAQSDAPRAAVISEFRSGVATTSPAAASFGFPNTDMFRFHAGPNFRVDGETRHNDLFFDILNEIANARSERTVADPPVNPPAPNLGLTFDNVNWIPSGRARASGVWEPDGLTRRANYFNAGWERRPAVPANDYLHERNNHPLPFTTFYRNVQLDLFADSPSTTWQPLAEALNQDPREVIVHGVTELFYDIPTLEGWIDVTIRGIRASQDDSEMTISLREGGGTVRETARTLLDGAAMFTGWGGGVEISAASIVPLDGLGVLSGIRIREGAVGRFLSPEPNVGGHNMNVRLVAPRNFVWDLAELELAADLVPDLEDEIVIRGARVTGNDAFGTQTTAVHFDRNARDVNPGSRAITIIDPDAPPSWINLGDLTYPIWNDAADLYDDPTRWDRPETNPFVNANTGRHEVILNVQMPPRASTFTARNTPAEITLRGISLIPVRGAATTGNLAIDVYVGDVAIPAGSTPRVDAHGSGTARILPRTPGQTRSWPTGSIWTERTDDSAGWRETGLVVATLDWDDLLEVIGPANVPEVRSGDWTIDVVEHNLPLLDVQHGLPLADNNRWLTGAYHTLRIQEIVQGTLYSGIDRYEIVPPEGVRIVDARIRGGRDGENADTFGWGKLDRVAMFIPGLYDYDEDDGSVTFATRRLAPEIQTRIRRMDLGLLLSVEAGFEHKYGDEISIRVYRNGNYIGSAVVADVYDPVILDERPAAQINRDAYDVLALTPVSGFSITEAYAGALEHGDQLLFTLRATQNGRLIHPRQFGWHSWHGHFNLYIADPEINEDESGFALRDLRGIDPVSGAYLIGWEVARTSVDEPARLDFDSVYVQGPVVPGLEWHVVLYGPEISANSHLILGDTDWLHGQVPIGGTRADNYILSDYVLRGRFYELPYDAFVLSVGGAAVIDEPPPPEAPARPAFTRATFRDGQMEYVPGEGNIRAMAFVGFTEGWGTAMLNPRVFANLLGATVDWDQAAGSASFTGEHIRTGQPVSITLTLGSPTAVIDGVSVDIAERVGQGHVLGGRIVPYVIDNRMFVPARVLGESFGMNVDWQNGTLILE